MRRYLVFNSTNYYPAGGWRDFAKSFDALDEAIEFAKSQVAEEGGNITDVVDAETEKRIHSYRMEGVWPDLKVTECRA